MSLHLCGLAFQIQQHYDIYPPRRCDTARKLTLNSDGILKYESLLTLKILKSLESESDSRTADRVAHILQLALQTSIPNIFPAIFC